MRRIVSALIASAGLGLPCSSVLAADHIDSPAASADPTADITDVYAWMSSDAELVNVVLNVHHMAGEDAMFSDAVQYVVHVNSSAAYGEEQSETQIICQFYAPERLECWAGDEYVEGDPSDSDGITSDEGGVRVFAGRRDDPFFFELVGFRAAVATVVDAAPDLTFTDGCPAVDATTSAALVSQLQHGEDDADASNSFAGSNVLSLVLQLDKTLLTGSGPILGIWASTHVAE